MPAPNKYKPFTIQPVDGLMDTRSSADAVQSGNYRYVLNHEKNGKGRMCRAAGFRKFLDKADYNNADLHDQLNSQVPEQISLLYEAQTIAGFSKLFAGTQTRVYSFNNESENWRLLVSGKGGVPEDGCSETKFSAASVNNIVWFTNDVDKPFFTAIDQPVEDDGSYVAEADDLDTINLTKARIVLAWNDFIIFANVVMDGERRTDRLVWSDFRRPLSFLPDLGVSFAGTKDLGSGETILAIKPLQNLLIIYTSKRIWQMTATGGENTFAFAKRFSPDEKTEAAVIAYPDTLASDGDAHYYFGRDAIYKWDLYSVRPMVVEWIHNASSRIFDNINTARCRGHVSAAVSDKDRRQILFSWVKNGENCPTETLAINLQYPFASFLDFGFTAGLSVEPKTNRSLADFILDLCICDQAGLDNDSMANEGGFCTAQAPALPCIVTPTVFYTSIPKEDGEIIVEDFDQLEADPTSLFAILGDVKPLDLCDAEFSQDACNSTKLFIVASSQDACIKEFVDVRYREYCTGRAGCGTYIRSGYRSRVTSPPLSLGIPYEEKDVERFVIEASPDFQTVPSQVILRIGVAGNAVDPLTEGGRCAILWTEDPSKLLQCLSEATAAEHQLNHTIPDLDLEWPLFRIGKYFLFEIEIVNAKVNPPDTGGSVCFSRYEFRVARHYRKR